MDHSADDPLIAAIMEVAPDAVEVFVWTQAHRHVTGEFGNGYKFSVLPRDWLRVRILSDGRQNWENGLWDLVILDQARNQVLPNPITGSKVDALVPGVGPDELREVLRKLAALPRI